MGKGEIARNDPSCFLIFWQTFPPFSSNLKWLSANFFVVLGKDYCVRYRTPSWKYKRNSYRLSSRALWSALASASVQNESASKCSRRLRCWTHLRAFSGKGYERTTTATNVLLPFLSCPILISVVWDGKRANLWSGLWRHLNPLHVCCCCIGVKRHFNS